MPCEAFLAFVVADDESWIEHPVSNVTMIGLPLHLQSNSQIKQHAPLRDFGSCMQIQVHAPRCWVFLAVVLRGQPTCYVRSNLQ